MPLAAYRFHSEQCECLDRLLLVLVESSEAGGDASLQRLVDLLHGRHLLRGRLLLATHLLDALLDLTGTTETIQIIITLTTLHESVGIEGDGMYSDVGWNS